MKKFKDVIIILIEIFAAVFGYGFINKIKLSVNSINLFSITLLVSIFFNFKYNKKCKDLTKSKKVLSHIFTIFMIVGEIISSSGNLLSIFKPIYFVVTIFKYIGYVVIFNNAIKLIDYFVNNKKDNKINKKSLVGKYIDILYKKPFLVSFLSISIVLLIYILAFYPIVLSPDPTFQIKMYFNIPTKYINWVVQRNPNIFMTNHHPIFHTYLLGWCLSLGRLILNDNFGLFIYTFFQSLCFSLTLSYTIKFMKDRGVKSKYLFIILIFYMFTPMFGFYSVSAVKDTFYTIIFIHLVLFIYDVICKRFNYISIKRLVYLFFIILLLSLFRQNGKYIVFIVIPVLAIYSYKNIIKLSCVFLLFLISIYGYEKILIPKIGISDGSIREALSVPFQQTARLVKYHNNLIEDKDKKVIDKILKYDTLKERYTPELSDKVKNDYNKDTTNDELKSYFKVWGKYLLKEPVCYINATLNNTYGYFYPNSSKWYLYYNYDHLVTENKLVNYSYNKLIILRNILIYYGKFFIYIPIIGLVSNVGFGLFSILYMITNIIDSKKYRLLIVLLPLIISILFCFVGPANTYFRYAMPYLFILPVLEILFSMKRKVIK